MVLGSIHELLKNRRKRIKLAGIGLSGSRKKNLLSLRVETLGGVKEEALKRLASIEGENLQVLERNFNDVELEELASKPAEELIKLRNAGRESIVPLAKSMILDKIGHKQYKIIPVGKKIKGRKINAELIVNEIYKKCPEKNMNYFSWKQYPKPEWIEEEIRWGK